MIARMTPSGVSRFDNVDTQWVTLMVMLTLNMRQLRDTCKLKAWLRAGKTVELRDRDRVLPSVVVEERERSRY